MSESIDSQRAYSHPLQAVIQVVQGYLFLPDPAPLVLTLATVVANRLDGSPVWLLLVGPPSSGKSEIACSTIKLPGVYETATLTEASLLSGTAKRDQAKNASGGLLKLIGNGNRGLIVMKDFTSVLSMSRESRPPVLAALREIFDGRWTRSVGTDGGKQLSWAGKVGLLAGVTQAIDSHHSVIASLGDRFLYYRMPVVDPNSLTAKVLGRDGADEEIQREIREQVTGFINLLEDERPEPLTAAEKSWLGELATITAMSRGAVERDSYRREITCVMQPESPARLAGCFGQLFLGLNAIGCSAEECRRLLRKVALDCFPRERARLILRLASSKSNMTAEEMKNDNGLVHPGTAVRRALDDMECFRIVERIEKTQLRDALAWKLTREYASKWNRIWTE